MKHALMGEEIHQIVFAPKEPMKMKRLRHACLVTILALLVLEEQNNAFYAQITENSKMINLVSVHLGLTTFLMLHFALNAMKNVLAALKKMIIALPATLKHLEPIHQIVVANQVILTIQYI